MTTVPVQSLPSGLKAIVDIVGNVFEAHSAVLFLREPGPEAYRLQASFSLSDDVLSGALLAPGEGLVGWMIRNQQPLLITNFDKKRGRLGYYRSGAEQNVRAFMGCPLGQGGVGALCLDSKRTYSFSERDQKILNQFAQLAASMALEAGRRRREDVVLGYYRCLSALAALRERFTRWEVYLEHFLTLVARASGFEHCVLAVRGEDGTTYSLEGLSGAARTTAQATYPLGSGLVGWVFKNNAPVVRGSCASGTEGACQPLFAPEGDPISATSALCLPLLVHRRVRGVLCMASSRPMQIDDELREFANLVAGSLALFLENLYLKNRLTP